MKPISKLFTFGLLALVFMSFQADKARSIYEFSVKDINGNNISLSKFEGKVLVIVNVASKCGLTPQYEDLQRLYDEYHEQGLEVLGFPANNFMNQEPEDEEGIKSFCTQKFGITFPMFSKISVKGKDIHPLYAFLTSKKENGVMDAPVKWNFQKFIIDRKGRVIDVIAPKDKVSDPEVLRKIEKALKSK